MPDYPKIVIPLNAGEPGWIQGGKMSANEDEFKLDDSLQAALLLMLGLARRGDLGTLRVKLEGVELDGDGWLKFTSGRFDEPIEGLKNFLEAHRETQIKKRLKSKEMPEMLHFPLLQNEGNRWRLAWAPENVCFSPHAFRGFLRLSRLQKGKRKGILTVEMNVIENDFVEFTPRPLLVAVPTSALITEALFFMNRNLEEIPAFAALGNGVKAFCDRAYRLLVGKEPTENENLLTFLRQPPIRENLTEDERQRLQKAQKGIRELARRHIAAERAKIDEIAFSVKGFLTRYVTLMEDIEALLAAKLLPSAKNQITWQKRATSAEDIEKKIEQLPKKQIKVRDRFRDRLRKEFDLGAKGCLDFYSNSGLLYYLIDFKIYDGDVCILPFHTERNRDRVLSLAPYSTLKAVVCTCTDVVEKDGDEKFAEPAEDDVLRFHIEGIGGELWSEFNEDLVLFENLLAEEYPLPENARLVIHPGRQRVWGIAVARGAP
jgi:hypothetical protein